MRIGIKFCGGCNSTYQRRECVDKLKQRFPEHTYFLIGNKEESEIVEGELLLVVCGCRASCVSGEKWGYFTERMVITCMKDFVEVEHFLEQKGMRKKEERKAGDESANQVRKRLQIGAKESMQRTFYKEETERFAALSGDKNRIHVDSAFAEKQWFGKRIVHGVLAASLMSSVMGVKLPGDGTILMEEQIAYEAPVYFGDTIQATVWFVSYQESKKCYIGTFYGECRNQHGDITARGIFRQMMMKSLFQVEKIGEAG